MSQREGRRALGWRDTFGRLDVPGQQMAGYGAFVFRLSQMRWQGDFQANRGSHALRAWCPQRAPAVPFVIARQQSGHIFQFSFDRAGPLRSGQHAVSRRPSGRWAGSSATLLRLKSRRSVSGSRSGSLSRMYSHNLACGGAGHECALAAAGLARPLRSSDTENAASGRRRIVRRSAEDRVLDCANWRIAKRWPVGG